MNKSEGITELAKALVKTQAEIKVAKRTQVNPFYHSRYADLAEIWEACREPLHKNGLAICQTIDTEGEKTYLETMLLHESGEWISGRQPLLLTKLDPQQQGSAITYARRYSLAAIIGVATEDDDAEATIEHPDVRSTTETEPKQSHWCPVHKVVFFKKGKMKNYAHPIAGTDEWCNEEKTEPEIGATSGVLSTPLSPLVKAAIEMGATITEADVLGVKDREFKNAGEFLMEVYKEFGFTKTKVLKFLDMQSIEEMKDIPSAWRILQTIRRKEDEKIIPQTSK